MKNYRLFINYKLLWREIQKSNRFKIAHSRQLRRGNSYVLYELCNRYKNLLNKLIKEGKTIDPDNLPLLYVASSEMYIQSPYQMKSITNCLQNLMNRSYSHLITIDSIFNESKFMVSIPLRYFQTLGNIVPDEPIKEIKDPYRHRIKHWDH